MFKKTFLFDITKILKRHYGQKPRPIVEFEKEMKSIVDDESFKPRKHPGRLNLPPIELPKNIKTAIKITLGDTPLKSVVADSKDLANYLLSRNYPLEENEINRKKSEIEKKVSALENTGTSNQDPETLEKLTKIRERKINKVLKETVHAWKNIQLDKYLALQYLVRRAPPDYAALYHIFREINQRVPNYRPSTFFDFGSGVGTGTWAARTFWDKSLHEYFTVDTSAEANDLARTILCGGEKDGEFPIKKYFQRQFLPANPIKFDVVLSAFSLFELPTAKSRLLTIQNLWRRTNDFLVLVELGTNAGFRIINEAREFILETQEGSLAGHVFSPCPHDTECPRYLEDNTPCNFPVRYKVLSFENTENIKKMLISYVVLKKGPRMETDEQWPRVVRPVLVRHKHAVCRMCCDDGKLKEIIFTAKKHGKSMFRCAKVSEWWDRLPINIQNIESDTQVINEDPNTPTDNDLETLSQVTETPDKT